MIYYYCGINIMKDTTRGFSVSFGCLLNCARYIFLDKGLDSILLLAMKIIL